MKELILYISAREESVLRFVTFFEFEASQIVVFL